MITVHGHYREVNFAGWKIEENSEATEGGPK